MEQWISIPTMAAQLGTSSNTVRRYIKRFPNFFMHKTVDGVRRYPVETLDILQRIFSLYRHEGKTKSEIKDIIATEFPQPIEVSGESDIGDTIKTPAAIQAEMLPSIKDELSRMATAYERIADVLGKQSSQERRIADLEKKLNLLISIDRHADMQPTPTNSRPEPREDDKTLSLFPEAEEPPLKASDTPTDKATPSKQLKRAISDKAADTKTTGDKINDIILSMDAEEHKGTAIARRLNKDGYTNQRGGQWKEAAIRRRLEKLKGS